MKAYKLTIWLFFAVTTITIYGCSFFVFAPSRKFSTNSVVQKADPKDIFFPSGDCEILHGWLFRAVNPKGTILVFHGNAENITTHVNGVLWLVAEGFNLFIMDYRGFGRSTGSPDLRGIHCDGLAALDYLLTLPGIDVNRIALLGQSIGGSVATYVAATSPQRDKVKLLVLDSTIYGYRLIAREKLSSFFLTWAFQYPFSLLINDDYSPSRWIGMVAAPVIVIKDTKDRIVPPDNSDLIYKDILTQKEIWTTSESGHISSLKNKEIRKALIEKLSESFSLPFVRRP